MINMVVFSYSEMSMFSSKMLKAENFFSSKVLFYNEKYFELMECLILINEWIPSSELLVENNSK